MGLAELVSKLEREADARVARMRADTDARVQAMSAAAMLDERREREGILASRAAERRGRLELELAQARQRARQDELAGERALVDRVLARVRELLDDIDRDAAYVAGLPVRVEQVLRFAPHEVVVRCRPSLAGAIRQTLERRPDASCEEVPDMAVGVVLVARDGSMEVDDTLPTRLARYEALLAATIVGKARP